MRWYVQFTVSHDEVEVVDVCGSDGIFILDGRNTLRTMKHDALERMYKLRNVCSIDGYKIMKGERFDNSVCLYEWLRSGSLIEHRNRHELQ